MGDLAHIAGALAFGIGVVFLIVGRAELFNENFLGPIAAIAEKRDAGTLPSLLRLWLVTFLFNLVGGGLFVLVFSVDGTLPAGAMESLSTTAEEIASMEPLPVFTSAIAGGALVSLLSFLLVAVNSVGSRIVLVYIVGFLLVLGPFDHVIVTVLLTYFGMLSGAPVGYGMLVVLAVIVTAGNLVGGIGLVTTTHIAQAMGSE